MTKLQWTAVAAALGLGVLAQIPRHDSGAMAGHGHPHQHAVDTTDAASESSSLARTAGLQTVSLHITGMT